MSEQLAITRSVTLYIRRGFINWASGLLQKVQAPLTTYEFNLTLCFDGIDTCRQPHELHGFLPECRFQNGSLQPPGQIFPPLNCCCVISFAQLNANFKNFVSLSLCNLVMLSTDELTLPHLELLHLTWYIEAPPSPAQGWNLPHLRHVCADGFLDITLRGSASYCVMHSNSKPSF
jgi:hypothetical protein